MSNKECKEMIIKTMLNTTKCCCIKCGIICDSKDIDMHHIDSITKLGNPSYILYRQGQKAYIEECKKCIPLCKDCHKELHKTFGYKNTTRENTIAFLSI